MSTYNTILAEFDFLIDMDLAIYLYIRNKFRYSDYVNKELINKKKLSEVEDALLNRDHINPLEIILPDTDCSELYYDLVNNKEEELLQYARTYDTFGLMITYLNLADPTDIFVLCKNELEADYIKKTNSRLETIIKPSRMVTNISKYTIIYLKYIAYAIEYNKLEGKNLLIAHAKYNIVGEDNQNIITYLSESNNIGLIDLYRKVKFTLKVPEEDN